LNLFLSKLLLPFLLPPGSALLLAGLGGLLLARGRRRGGQAALWLAFAWLWLSATTGFGRLVRFPLESRYPAVAVAKSPSARAILVLGGGVGPDLPPRRSVDLGAAADRVVHAARLYRAGKAPLVVLAGGRAAALGFGPAEAESMAAVLEEWGVPRTALLLETRSRNTRQNCLLSKPILESRGAGRVLLVTSAVHMPRALATCRKVGLDVVASPTDFRITGEPHAGAEDWLPDPDALGPNAEAIKEWLGLVWYRLRGWT